jgi:hypothetical protein
MNSKPVFSIEAVRPDVLYARETAELSREVMRGICSLSKEVRGVTDETTVTEGGFAERLGGILTGGMLSLMISVGYRTGLFDAMETLPPSSSPTSRRQPDWTSVTCASGWGRCRLVASSTTTRWP